MRKFSLLVLIVLTFSTAVLAQSYEGTVQYDKKKQAAIIIEYAYPPQAVENAFIQKMESLGYRAKEEKGLFNKDKGFIVFSNAAVSDISKERLDYIIKSERKSRKENEETIFYLVLIKNGENAMEKLMAYDIGNAKAYLNDMLPDIEAANLELLIKAEEEELSKTEKKLKGLQDDKSDLEKKLADNAKSQDETVKEIETLRENLEKLKAKRNNE